MEKVVKNRVSQRIARIAPSATLAVDARAKELASSGESIIGFGAGEPDFATPSHIVEAAQLACSDPANHRYTPGAGLPGLRQAIANKTLRDSGLEVSASSVVVTNGGKQAIYEAFAALLDPGDEVIVPTPYWTTYPEAIRLAGGVPVFVEADQSTGFRVDVAQLDEAVTDRTKLLLFCSPSNPTGAIYSEQEVQLIADWLLKHGIWVVTDEIYEHFNYTGTSVPSLPVVNPQLRDRTIIVNGVAKAYAMTGWRVGWLIGPPDIVAAVANLQSHLTSNVNNVAQHAAIAALEAGTHGIEQMRQEFAHRRRLIVDLINQVRGFTCLDPDGAFYAFADITGALGRSSQGVEIASSAVLAEILLEQAGVAAVPGEAFGSPGYLRFSYALGEEDIRAGLGRISQLMAQTA